MSNKPSEAAGRIRRIKACVEKSQDIYGVIVDPDCRQSIHEAARIVKRRMLDDERTIIDAYLAEHPDDDGEPVTEEWLKSIGFEQHTDPDPECDQTWQLHGRGDELILELVRVDDRIWQEVHIGWPHDIHARVQVRLLVKATTC